MCVFFMQLVNKHNSLLFYRTYQMNKLIEYTPAALIYNKMKTDFAESGEGYEDENTTNTSSSFMVLFSFIILIFFIIIPILNIVGIVYEFRCNYITLGVVSIIAALIGIPIGLIFYIVYLINPSICQK